MRKLSEVFGSKLNIPKRAIANIFVSFMTVILAILSVNGIFASQRVRWIFILGQDDDSLYTESEIIEASGIEYGQPLFSSDTETAQKNICKNKPYISEAVIRPWVFSIMTVRVKYDTPEYYINDEDKYYVLSGDLRILECVYSKDSLSGMDLVKLELPDNKTYRLGQVVTYGPQKEQEKYEFVRELIDSLKKSEYGDLITEIGIPNRFDGTYITFSDKCRIILGEPGNIDLKITYAVALLQKNTSDGYDGCCEINVADQKAGYTFRRMTSLD